MRNTIAFLKPVKSAAPAVLALLMAGCASGVKNPSGVPVTQMSADERGFVAGTGIESQDIVAVTEKIARNVLNIPEITAAQVDLRVSDHP